MVSTYDSVEWPERAHIRLSDFAPLRVQAGWAGSLRWPVDFPALSDLNALPVGRPPRRCSRWCRRRRRRSRSFQGILFLEEFSVFDPLFRINWLLSQYDTTGEFAMPLIARTH